MKIRTGFVSNSSSSSFIVAFDKVPESSEEMMQQLFGPAAKNDEIVEVYDASATQEQIAERVFSDCVEQKTNSRNIRKMLERLFEYRYYFSSSSRRPSPRPEEWWGTDAELLDELYEVSVEDDRASSEYWKKHHARIKEVLGTTDDTNDKAYKAFLKRVEEFETNDAFLKELKAEHYTQQNDRWRKQDELAKTLAKKDVAAFLKSMKGKTLKIFSYGDDRGEFESILEHGNTFSALPHLTVSQH